jgi:hypothetical protein
LGTAAASVFRSYSVCRPGTGRTEAGLGWESRGTVAEDWPDWLISTDNASELARYVDLIRTRAWVPADCLGPWVPSEGTARARGLYEALRGHRIPYAHEPWNPASLQQGATIAYQRIRGPDETMQGPATCLDLTLVFAGMAVAADMRPLIGLRSSYPRHALVVLDLTGPLSDQNRKGEWAGPAYFAEHADEPGVWVSTGRDGQDPDDGAAYRHGRWMIIDIERAARHEGKADGDLLPRTSPEWLVQEFLASEPGGEVEWTLVDVNAVLSRKDSYRAGPTLPPIHGYLPVLPAFRDYPTRGDLMRRLFAVVGPENPASTVVVHGPWGYGKSMLAHRLAVAADHGCGWFLNATDGTVLTTSLALAERQEKNMRGGDPAGTGADSEKPDPGEDRALASAALDRLRNAALPWVVVLDNCDQAAESPGLMGLIPRPSRPGQFVIITTTHEGWAEVAARRTWTSIRLPPLGGADISDLGLPAEAKAAVDGRPLIAQALAALRADGGVEYPEQAAADGAALVWQLLRTSQHAHPDVVAAARALAWCPPEAMDIAGLLSAAGIDTESPACDILAALRFATRSGPDAGAAVQMHRRLAEAVRNQTWSEAPAAAAEMIERLLTSKHGRQFFIEAADTTALGRLEGTEPGSMPGDVHRAAGVLTDPERAGMLWYALGLIRERRGPVRQSGAHFAAAEKILNPAQNPAELAESLIGQARVTFQDGQATVGELREARATAEKGQDLLGSVAGVEARQMREQGNALAWLIARRLAGEEKDPARRESLLIEVRDNLWQSYERRRHIIRPRHHFEEKTPPEPDDGLGPERAYYNLAGTSLQLAKTRHELARKLKPGSEERAALIRQAEQDLDEAAEMYQAVGALREARYDGRAHPHLAACLHGQALIAYYRAVLLGKPQTGRLAQAFEFAGAAMEQRRKIASSLAGPGTAAVLRDPDLAKSVEFTMKIAFAGTFGRFDDPTAGAGAAMAVAREALMEWLGRLD